MAISKDRKDDLVAQYGDLLSRSEAVFVTEYKGMTAKQIEELRGKVREKGGAFHITKNTLFRVALEQANKPVPSDLLQGQTAVSFAFNDAPALAKMLLEMSDKVDLPFELRGGMLDTSIMNAAQVKALSNMPSKQELQVKLLSMMLQPAQKLVTVMNAPAQDLVSVMNNGVSQMVNVLNAYVRKMESEQAES